MSQLERYKKGYREDDVTSYDVLIDTDSILSFNEVLLKHIKKMRREIQQMSSRLDAIEKKLEATQ